MGGSETSGADASSGETSDVSAPVTLDVGSLEAFNPKGDRHGLNQRWKRWKRAFNLYVSGKGVTNDLQNRSLLLHVAGMEVQEVYFTLVGEDTIATFQDTLKVMDDYLIPKANVPFERHLFWQITQENSEIVDQFVCRLPQCLVSCDFGEQEDDYNRDQVMDKCCSSHMRRKFLEKERTLTLEDLLRIARSQEAVDCQIKVMVSNAGADQVNVLGGNKRSARSRVCYACGLDGHFSGDKRCPACGQACRRCGGIGHFRVRCPQVVQQGSGELRATTSGRSGPSRGKGVARGDKAGARGRFQSKPVKPREPNRVVCEGARQQPSSPVQKSPEHAFSVERRGDQAIEKSGSVSLAVGGVHLGEVLIDSAATCNVLSEPGIFLNKEESGASPANHPQPCTLMVAKNLYPPLGPLQQMLC